MFGSGARIPQMENIEVMLLWCDYVSPTQATRLHINHHLPQNVRWFTVYYFRFSVSLGHADHSSDCGSLGILP